MANTLNLGNGNWAVKKDSLLGYNSENGNFKPLPFDFTRSTSATRVNKDGLIEVVSNNKPRIDFLNDSNGALLLEPQRTNLLLRSEEFDNASWVKLGQGTGSVPIVTPNYAISPDGTQNASRLQCDLNGGNTTNDRSWLYQSITDVVVESTFSLYVKNISSETIIFTLNNGSSGTISVSPDSQWHRLYSVKTGGAQPRIGLIGGVGASDNADLLIWGSQLEQGYQTSYIPTQGSVVTRVAETNKQTPPDGVIGQTEGSVYIEVNISNTTSKTIFALDTGSASNFIILDTSSSLSPKILVRQSSGSFPAIITGTTMNYGVNKIAFCYKYGDYAMYVNGLLSGTSSSTTFPSGILRDITIGGNPSYGFLSDSVNDFKLYNTRLSNAELQALTS
jgi:hypothetical protein